MTPDDVARLLDYLTKAYPQAQPPETGTPLIWLQHLNETDLATARSAAHRWVDREKWMPTVAEFKDECRTVRREEWIDRDNAPAVPLGTQPALEVGEADEDAKAVSRAFFAAMREALAVQSTLVHNHHGPPGSCPVCGGTEEERGRFAATIDAIFTKHKPPVWAGPEQRYDCACGDGEGWVEDDTGAVRPCASCRPEMWERWKGGHFKAGHHCNAACEGRAAS